MTTAVALARPSPTPNWAPFRDRLQVQRTECIDQRDLALAETVTSVPDPVALRRAASLLRTVEEIDTALDRIESGTYGRCTNCASDIPLERLELRPFAATCVSCSEPG